MILPKRSLILFIFFFIFSINETCAEDYSSIKIYFVRWDIKTRVSLTPDAVRNWRQLYMEINDDYMISIVSNAIFSNKFNIKNPDLPEKGPANLVIDFINRSGKTTTIYANNGFIVNTKTNMCNRISNKTIKAISSLLNID